MTESTGTDSAGTALSGTALPARRVIAHIGWPKTATTSMQAQLRVWPNLAGRPWTRPDGDRSRALLRRLVVGDQVSRAELDRLFEVAWVDRSRPVVLSDEALVALPRWQHQPGRPDPSEVPPLLTASSWPTTVLVTLRQPAPMLRSAYRYAVKAGYDRSYREYLAEITANLDQRKGPMSLRSLLSAWEAAVGEGNVVVAWMEDYAADPGAFWRSVAQRVGAPELADLAAAPTEHLNRVRLNPLWLELALNRGLAVHRGKRRSRSGRRLRRTFNRKITRRLPEGRTPVERGAEHLEREVVRRLEHDLDWVCEHFHSPRPYERGERA